MGYLYLVLAVIGLASSSISGSFFNRKNENRNGATPLYSLISGISVFVLWGVLFLFDGTVETGVILYSLLFACGFACSMISLVYALKTGPIVLTSLIMQLSLIITTVWGFFFWGTQFTWLILVGLILIVISLWLCLYTKKKEENKINLRWIIWTLLAFIGNATCTIVQRTQQMNFDGKYGNFMMMVATFISMLFCLVMYLLSDKSHSKIIIKTSWYYPVATGTLNVLLNFCMIMLATTSLSPSLIYPVIAIASLALTTVFSAFVFKEKMRPWQWVGVFIGAIAVAILSI